MAETIGDFEIGDEWVSLNSLASIPVGVAFDIQNKRTRWVRLIESATQPAPDSEDGKVLVNLNRHGSTASVVEGSLEIWAKSYNKGVITVVNVQEL